MQLTESPRTVDTVTADAVQELIDRHEIVDVLHRFALGRDLKDPDLFRSAFTHDAEFDFRPVGARIGLEFPVMHGVDMITQVVMDPEAGLDTSHTVTNCRARITGDEALLTALVEAQHLPGADHSRHLLLKNVYDVALVRDGRRWLARRITVDNLWFTGDPQVILGR
ncbi:nuclear transport factor 2 family protein [Streptomyces sp. V17-9]|uniref:nuclear transport factor 2 family protein n=1 Tax=Streptomyces sp. V17-9 TaxID=2831149 RepID=UPI001BB0959C|nr:nuclear transport factor 2 family protein [Streptomyces sp. V17-9]QUW93863.1 hypothetical protein KE639_05115 [Streptomyces sp. V17-9]